MIIGIIIVIVGLAFLLQSLGFISVSAWQFIWPSLLIVAGLGIICKEKGNCCCGENCEKPKK
ncbi:MAG: DUF5668 domain-containing protein [Candidatus Paceibacterota bacterium]|jgi:hypothetical protein